MLKGFHRLKPVLPPSESVPDIGRKIAPLDESHPFVYFNGDAIGGSYCQARALAAMARKRFERTAQQFITEAAVTHCFRNADLGDVTDFVRYQTAQTNTGEMAGA